MKFRIIEKAVYCDWLEKYEQKYLVQKKGLFWWKTLGGYNSLKDAEWFLSYNAKRLLHNKNKPNTKVHLEIEVDV